MDNRDYRAIIIANSFTLKILLFKMYITGNLLDYSWQITYVLVQNHPELSCLIDIRLY
jgi:hypothetical protein